MRILIVEDNASMRRLIRQAVSPLAAEVRECESGADALAVYMDQRPDLVLMDIRMPRMDGLAATRHIRQSDPSARVLMVTDYDDDELRKAAREAGACGYAVKQDLTNLVGLIGIAMDSC